MNLEIAIAGAALLLSIYTVVQAGRKADREAVHQLEREVAVLEKDLAWTKECLKKKDCPP
jgi:hypothetical protein